MNHADNLHIKGNLKSLKTNLIVKVDKTEISKGECLATAGKSQHYLNFYHIEFGSEKIKLPY